MIHHGLLPYVDDDEEVEPAHDSLRAAETGRVAARRRSSAEDSSAVAPARSTRTVSSRPAAVRVASKPAAIACRATSTPTTPAMPTTTTEVAPNRSGTVARPIQVIASD